MNLERDLLPFPTEKPSQYNELVDEPQFNAQKHLQLERPGEIKTLKDIGYDEDACASAPSQLGITSAFRVFSDEGLAIVYDLAKKMESNKNKSTGTGINRLGSYIRGAGYRSQFIRDFCECPHLADFLSYLTGVRVARHSLPSIACGINYAPEDISKAVDTWHVDSMSFDIVVLLNEPHDFKGGEFQYFNGTKQEGERILGSQGEKGSTSDLPADRITTVDFQAAGYGFLQQGNMILHRATRLLEKGERITFIPAFVILDPSKRDGTNVDSLMQWTDPGILVELARHQAWLTRNHLDNQIESLSLNASPAEIAGQLEQAASELIAYSTKLKKLV